jgi:DNA-binding transcriptional regulator YdaS (Cro superfamily)
MMTSKQAKDAAVEAAGGLSAVARAFTISPQAVWKWDAVPADRVVALEALCGGKVSRYDMRPDIFGPAPAPAKAAA